MHFHLIVSRKDQSNKIKISPLTNHKNTKKGAIKGGFDRRNLFQQAETGFDKLFGYQRDLQETFMYCNTMKNGNIIDKLQMQEQELKVAKKPFVPEIEPNEKQRRANVGTDIQPNVWPVKQPASQPKSRLIIADKTFSLRYSPYSPPLRMSIIPIRKPNSLSKKSKKRRKAEVRVDELLFHLANKDIFQE